MIITSFIAAMVSFPNGNITKKLLANELGIMPSSVFLINLAPWRVLVLIQVASLRSARQAHALKTKRPAQTKRNIGKERAAALDRLPTRPLFLLPMKSCVVKTFVSALSLF